MGAPGNCPHSRCVVPSAGPRSRLGHGTAFGPDLKSHSPEFNISGEFLVIPFVEPCAVTGTLHVMLGAVSPLGPTLEQQSHTSTGTVEVDCGSGATATFELTGTGNCIEKLSGEITGEVETPFNCVEMIAMSGFCDIIPANCFTQEDLQYNCFLITDPSAFSCTLAGPSVVTDGGPNNFEMVSGTISLTSVSVGGIVSLSGAAATPLESVDSSGSAVLLAGGAAGISAVIVAVIGAAWYVRRRRTT